MIKKIILFSIKNKLVIGIFTALLIFWGIWSATKIPIDAVPDITNNQVQVITVSPTLASQEVEQLVTFPIEQSIATVPKITEMRSISRFGLSVITVVFEEDVDIYFARQLIGERLKEASQNIPQGVGTPEMAPVSTGLGEIYQYILHPKKGSETKYDAKDLRTMQDWIVARQLYGTPGVAEVNSFGGELKQYEVAVNPDRLKAMGVSISDIFTALENNNENTGGAYIEKNPNAYFIRGIGLVKNLDDIKNIPVKRMQPASIYIGDIAEVKLGHAVRYGALTYNGKVDAVGGIVMMLKGENSNEVVKKIKEKLPTIQKSLPDDILIEPYLDRTDLIHRAIQTVEKNLIEGALIVVFVLILFLGNFRAGLIVASAIPLSMLFALGMMQVFGVSANLMSLGAIDFGLIVDGSVIIVEATLHVLSVTKLTSIHHRFTQKEMDEKVGDSASKMMNSAIFGQIVILIVYIPILSLTGIEGKMFRPMAQTVSFAIVGAMILSLTYIPMMSALFLSKKKKTKQNISDKLMNQLQKLYRPLLEKSIKFKYMVVSVAIALFLLCAFIFSRMGGEFIPQLQEGDFAFHCILPQGSSLSQSIETSMQASRIIKSFDEVKMVIGKTGAGEVPTDPMPPEATDLMIILKPQDQWKSHRNYEELADAIMKKLQVIPGIFFEKNQPIQMRFNELMTGVRQDVAVKIFGENIDSLVVYADNASRIIQNVRGASLPQVEKISGLPQINVEYDRVRMANYGLNVQEVNAVLSTAFAGKSAGKVYENERSFDLVVRLDSAYRKDISNVRNLMIPIHEGTQIPLSQIAEVNYKLGPAQISREDGKRRIVIGFNVSERDIQSVVEEIQEKLNQKINLPTGYYFTYGGQFENLQEASNRLLIAIPVSLLLIFIILYFTFQSVKQALLIYTAIPMSAIGGVLALLIRGMPFSVSAGIGFIALFGVAVLNGIVLIGTFNQLEKEGVQNVLERVKTGTILRLRPVLMTATVASLGFLPMAVSTGSGAEVQKPLATVVIGGLFSATLLTLFVLPLLYILFNSKNKFKFKMKSKLTFILLFMLFLGFTAQAQDKTISSVEEAIEIAEENNAYIQTGKLQIESKKENRKTSGELPKLNFSAELGNYNGPEFDNAFQVSQTIPFPTVFSAKKKLADAEIKEKEIELKLTESELKKQIRLVYYEIQYLQNRNSELKKLDSLYEDFTRIADLRYRVGDTKKVDISTANAKKGEIHLLWEQNQTALSNAKRNLRLLLNSDDDYEVRQEAEFRALEFLSLLDSSNLKNHPAIQLVKQKIDIAEKNILLQKAHNAPDFTLGYTNQSLIGYQTVDNSEVYYDADKRYSFFNIGISIPVSFGANNAKIKSLAYLKQSSELEAEQKSVELSADYENLMNQYEQDLRKLNYYTQEALPNSEEIISAAQLGYQTGNTGYVEYLYALETVTGIRLNYLQSINEINQTVIKIYNLINL